jgi:hypothetical protein
MAREQIIDVHPHRADKLRELGAADAGVAAALSDASGS